MSENNRNPLGLENRKYTVEEFAFLLRSKFGGDNNVSDIVLTEIFLAKYPMYSCKISRSQHESKNTGCSCC
tara:strand:+ start:655 stop:867 length:213 start_codon:yes stop_codon:yes gene_type:complete